MSEEAALRPECYMRHAEIDNHITASKFWRGVIVAAFLSFIGISISQLNIANENNRKLTELITQLKTTVEVNSKRIGCLEDIHPRAGLPGSSLYTGVQNGK